VDATTETIVVERELEIDASPETVWELLTDPAEATRWMGQSAEFDLRPGGTYRVGVIPGHSARGEFVEIDPPRRLAYTWGWEAEHPVPPGSSMIEFDLVPRDAGTLLRFRHSGLPTAESAASHSHGWDHYFDRLATVAGGGDPGVDPWLSGDMRGARSTLRSRTTTPGRARTSSVL
jgi:uncharacterized protein YndB with AHSA1/START domain